MIDRNHPLPITRQARALGVARSTVYALPRAVSDRDLDLIKRMGIEALYRKPKTTKKHPEHRVYPYLLRGLTICRPGQVYAMDITYVPMARGFVYLAAVMDGYSRKVLSWRVSITLDMHLCLEAMEDAIARYGKPEIVNTDIESGFAVQTNGATSLTPFSNGSGGQCKVVGQKGVLDARIDVFIANTTKPDGAVFCLGSRELNGLIAVQTFGFEHRSALNDTVSSVCF